MDDGVGVVLARAVGMSAGAVVQRRGVGDAGADEGVAGHFEGGAAGGVFAVEEVRAEGEEMRDESGEGVFDGL